MRARVVIALVVLTVAGAVVAVVLTSGEPSGCDDDGRCHGLRAGRPVDSPATAAEVAGLAIDTDPGPGLTSRCRFRGIVGQRSDVYRCQVSYAPDGHFLLHLERKRASDWYGYVIVDHRRAGASKDRRGERGRCLRDGNPPCPLPGLPQA